MVFCNMQAKICAKIILYLYRGVDSLRPVYPVCGIVFFKFVAEFELFAMESTCTADYHLKAAFHLKFTTIY